MNFIINIPRFLFLSKFLYFQINESEAVCTFSNTYLEYDVNDTTNNSLKNNTSSVSVKVEVSQALQLLATTTTAKFLILTPANTRDKPDIYLRKQNLFATINFITVEVQCIGCLGEAWDFKLIPDSGAKPTGTVGTTVAYLYYDTTNDKGYNFKCRTRVL